MLEVSQDEHKVAINLRKSCEYYKILTILKASKDNDLQGQYILYLYFIVNFSIQKVFIKS